MLSGNSKEYAPTVLADFYMSSLMSHGVLMNGVCGNPSYVGTYLLLKLSYDKLRVRFLFLLLGLINLGAGAG